MLPFPKKNGTAAHDEIPQQQSKESELSKSKARVNATDDLSVINKYVKATEDFSTALVGSPGGLGLPSKRRTTAALKQPPAARKAPVSLLFQEYTTSWDNPQDYFHAAIANNERDVIIAPKLSRQHHEIPAITPWHLNDSFTRHLNRLESGDLSIQYHPLLKTDTAENGHMSTIKHSPHIFHWKNGRLTVETVNYLEKVIEREKRKETIEQFIERVKNERYFHNLFYPGTPEATITFDSKTGEPKGYIAAQFVGKVNLAKYLRSRPYISLRDNHIIISSLFGQVDQCYVFKFIHFDLKPTNIMLDENNNAKLIDFGLATKMPDDPNQQVQNGGSWFFAAPEILSGYETKPANAKKYNPSNKEREIYTLAIIMLEMYSFDIERRFIRKDGDRVILVINFVEEALGNLKSLHNVFTKNKAKQLISLIQDMLHHNPQKRPTLSEVRERYNKCEPTELDILKSKIRQVLLKLNELNTTSKKFSIHHVEKRGQLYKSIEEIHKKCDKDCKPEKTTERTIELHNEMVSLMKSDLVTSLLCFSAPRHAFGEPQKDFLLNALRNSIAGYSFDKFLVLEPNEPKSSASALRLKP